jgi:hypothetical protein
MPCRVNQAFRTTDAWPRPERRGHRRSLELGREGRSRGEPLVAGDECICDGGFEGHGASRNRRRERRLPGATGSPEAVTRPRLPQNVRADFPHYALQALVHNARKAGRAEAAFWRSAVWLPTEAALVSDRTKSLDTSSSSAVASIASGRFVRPPCTSSLLAL